MTGTLWKRCDRQIDGRTDGRTERGVLRAAWSLLKSIKRQELYAFSIQIKSITISDQVKNGAGDALSPIQCQAISWTNADLLLIRL